MDWYNHPGIGLHTPAHVHYGLTDQVAATRDATFAAARAAHPERFTSTTSPKILDLPRPPGSTSPTTRPNQLPSSHWPTGRPSPTEPGVANPSISLDDGPMSYDHTFVDGFAFDGYRSFIQPSSPLYPMGKVNLLAGQNNAGKSNVLRFARDLLNATPIAPSAVFDRPQTTLPQDWAISLRLYVRRLDPPEPAEQGNIPNRKRAIAALKTAPGLAVEDGFVFRYTLSERSPRHTRADLRTWGIAVDDEVRLAEHFERNGVSTLNALNALTGKHYAGGSSASHVRSILEFIAPDLSKLPKVQIIQAFRQIREPSEAELHDAVDSTALRDGGLFNGVGLIKALQQLESPTEIGSDRALPREKYERINSFVRHILDDESATLHIPHDFSTVQVERNSSVLPLESLGTGVHQVVLLAAAATLISGTLIGLEEPEVHLHPLLQRRLVRYLAENTDNQYLIATHSAHLLDYEAGTVFHLTYGEAGTDVSPASTPSQLSRVCADLGYRPSDLLQSNAVIWVEGPSDRVYIRKWLELADPNLIEGIHYSIMFYGGGLLRHLTSNDPGQAGLSYEYHEAAVQDFISLRRLNRHLAVVIDSDKTGPNRRINRTKARVRDEFNGDGAGLAWVTDCYTIENYVPRALLEQAMHAVHPRWKPLADEGIWANPLRFEGDRQADKVAIARYVTERWTRDHLKTLRLDRRVEALAELIRRANGRIASAV